MESYSYTNREVVIFGHTWELNGYDLSKSFSDIHGFKSKEFSASENSNEKFYIELAIIDQPAFFNEFGINNQYLNVCLRESSTNKSSKYAGVLSISFEKNSYCLKSSSNSNQLKIPYSDLYNTKSKEIEPDDTLKIHCKITMFLDSVCKSRNKIQVPKCKILNDFAGLLNSEEFSDVTIVTGDGKYIPAHKNILSARSKVFAAMFKHPLEESQQNCVKICDFKYKVVLEMLRFIYTGCASNLQDMTAELLSAADKYDLERLKAMCLNYLHENLCVENAAMTLKLADLYQEKELKSIAVQYIKDNSEDVFKTPIWKGFAKTDKILMLETICALKLNDK